MTGVQFKQFLTKGTGLTGRPIGANVVVFFFLNGVEMQFDIDPSVRATHIALKARQWAGPEKHWVKRGSPLLSPWVAVSANPGSGADDPDPNNVRDSGAVIAYYDSPGPTPGASMYHGASRIHVVQNFTGWIEGTSKAGGSVERLCEVAGWFSKIDIANANWDGSDGPGTPPKWSFIALTEAGTGWRDVVAAPVI